MTDKLFGKSGKGWFRESLRHSNAVKLGVAGPIYASGGKSVGVNFGGKGLRFIKPKEYLITVQKKQDLEYPFKKPSSEFHMIPVVAKNKKEARKEIIAKPDYRIIDVIRKPKEKGGKVRDEKFYKWINASLTNDETSSDKELTNYFVKEGKMSRKEAKFYVKQREKALLYPLRFSMNKYGGKVKVLGFDLTDEQYLKVNREAQRIGIERWNMMDFRERQEKIKEIIKSGGKFSIIEQSKSLPIGKYSGIPAKSIWVRSNLWRGYFTFKNSVADGWIANAMGDPYGEAHNESENRRMRTIKSILRKNNIPYETKHTRTSNVFSIGYDILVPPEDVPKAKKLLRHADLGGKKFRVFEKQSGLGYYLGSINSKSKKFAEKKLRMMGLKEVGVLGGKKITFERGRIHRAKRDVLARRLEKVKGIKTPYALASSMIKKGYGVKNGEVKREFAEQKAMMGGKMLPIYKIKGKFYFRDACLGEYRNIKNPSDSMKIDSVANSMLQKPTLADRKKVFGGKFNLHKEFNKIWKKPYIQKQVKEIVKMQMDLEKEKKKDLKILRKGLLFEQSPRGRKRLLKRIKELENGGKFNLESVKRELKRETRKGSRQTKKGIKDFLSDVNDFMKFRKMQSAKREFGELGIRYVGGKTSSQLFAYNKKNLKNAMKYRGDNRKRILEYIEFNRTHIFDRENKRWVERKVPIKKIIIS